MGIFTAEVEGENVTLRYREGRAFLVIEIAVSHIIPGFDRTPYWYEYLEAVGGNAETMRQYATIRIVASPGVKIKILENGFFPSIIPVPSIPERASMVRGGRLTRRAIAMADTIAVNLEVIRVQDPFLLPDIGDEPRLAFLTGVTEVNAPQNPFVRIIPANWIIIVADDRSTSFHHIRSRQCLRVEVPQFLGVDIDTPTASDGDRPFTGLLEEPEDTSEEARLEQQAHARFAYAVEPDGAGGPLLRIISTLSVRYTLSPSAIATQLYPDPPSADDGNTFRFEVYPNGRFHQIPLPGRPLPRPSGASPYFRRIEVSEDLMRDIELRNVAVMGLEMAIGQIPVVGYLYDWGCFLYGMAYGRDLWGRRLTQSEVVLLGIAAAVPIVDGTTLREASRMRRFLAAMPALAWILPAGISLWVLLLRTGASIADILGPGGGMLANLFPIRLRAPRPARGGLSALRQRADTAAELVEALQEAERRGLLPPAVRAQLAEAQQSILRGQALGPQQLERVVEITRNIIPPQTSLPVTWILNADETGFVHPELNRLYRASGSTSPPQNWASRLPEGSPARLLIESVLGPNYLRVLPTPHGGLWNHPRNFYYRLVPRPVSLTAERIDEVVQNRFIGNESRIRDRLGELINQMTNSGSEAHVWAQWCVRRADFAILKGNIAEVLSEPRQAQLLNSYRRRFPDAELISGVRIRLPDASQDLLFSDNIIIRRTGNGIEILGVIEVKGGIAGGRQATDQIFRWSQRFEPGVEIVFPAGTRIHSGLASAGRLPTPAIITQEQRFIIGSTTSPLTVADQAPVIPVSITNDSVVGNFVTNLDSARRHIITVSGSSGQGMNTVRDIDVITDRIEMSYSSRELDYLTSVYIDLLFSGDIP